MDDRIRRIAAWAGVADLGAAGAVALLEEGCTIPFIARYRKDRTGGMDEGGLRAVEKALARQGELEARRETIRKAMEEQGALTDERRAALDSCWDRQGLEDLYLPFRRARKTRASAARAAGLEPLARRLLGLDPAGDPPLAAAISFVDPARGVHSAGEALAGARDIAAEEVATHPGARAAIRRWAAAAARLASRRKRGAGDAAAPWQDWFDHREALDRAPPHRILAMLRGEEQGALSLSLEVDEARGLRLAREPWRPHPAWREPFLEASEDGWKRLLWPAVERELLGASKGAADEASVRTFEANLRALLMAPPARGKRVLGVDPGFRNGCKCAAVDETGRVLGTATVYPNAPQGEVAAAARILASLVERHRVGVLAVGDGTAHRETLTFLQGMEWPRGVELEAVSEAGASVWSASEDAARELPDLDVTLRGAVSIARRHQDPLAALVCIDPRALGVGQYQHDVDPKLLAAGLEAVVEECVGRVGVELNTASAPLLARVAGIGPRLAEAIVARRDEAGPFRSRAELRRVPGLGPARFTQCAGFLRIPGAREPLDRTGIHPESYEEVTRTVRAAGTTVEEILGRGDAVARLRGLAPPPGLGPAAWSDALDELARPGRDPRGERQVFAFREDVRTVEDLQPGMVLPGRVTNVTDFGAFVDVGVHRDGLVHISALADRRVGSPFEVVRPGQTVRVKVLEVDRARNRISLSLRPSEVGEHGEGG
ncbi:MAG: RNA-binding transcriptional accessory protein [Deltaproteobacteria bacterium]|nr:RNA-binding transcriptional accessory protein [Deltaproteobacteria bacterium]